MDTIEIDGTGDTTTVVVQMALNSIYAKRDIGHDAMGVKFMQWLREIPDDVRTKLLAGIYIEYALAAHINTKNEEDALAELNVHDDEVVNKVIRAAFSCRKYASVGAVAQVEVAEMCEYLREKSMLLPQTVVYAILKTLEYTTGEFVAGENGEFAWHAVE